MDAVSDILIALAYFLIPLALVSFFRQRRDLQFSWIFMLFGIFILSCGLTHILAVWTLWNPLYRLEALVKAITALSSVLTAVMLWRILPALLVIPSPDRLQKEIDERLVAEQQIRRLNAELEARVAQRTAELTEANAALRAREEAISRMEQRLRLALDGGNIGTWDYDVAEQQVVVDDRCRAAFGLPAGAVVDREQLLKAVHPDDLESLRTQVAALVFSSPDNATASAATASAAAFKANGEGRFSTDLRVTGITDKVVRTLAVRGRCLFEPTTQGETPVRIVGTSADITSRKQQEEELIRLNEDLRQFAFAAAHDLQEPLRNISVSIQLLDMQFAHLWNEEARELVSQSIEGAQRMNAMLKDLLTYSRVIEHHEGAVENVHASAALDDALQNLRSRVQESGAEIVRADLPEVQISKLHLSQLFQNLIGNAIKYRKDTCKPLIRIQAEREKDKWQFAVSDNGIGFNPVYSDRIFGMFKRLNGRHEYGGNGIGLAICKRIVKHYGGSIWAESSPGEGSTFRFTLPA